MLFFQAGPSFEVENDFDLEEHVSEPEVSRNKYTRHERYTLEIQIQMKY